MYICPRGCGECPQLVLSQADQISEKYNHATVWSSLERASVRIYSASQIFDLPTRLDAPFFFYFPHLCSCSLLSRGAAGTSRSPCGEAGAGEVPTLIPERATYHCHSLLIKGINSKSLKFYLLAGAKRKVWMSLTMLWKRNARCEQELMLVLKQPLLPSLLCSCFVKQIVSFLKYILVFWLQQQLKSLCVYLQTFLINAFQLVSNSSMAATVLTTKKGSRQSLLHITPPDFYIIGA